MINCLVVDDEPLARAGLADYISEIDFLHLTAQCKSAMEAEEWLQKADIQLMFLDIQMPKLTGLEFLKSLPNPPLVIFITAYSEHALESYELNVLDYLLKPVSFSRFLQAARKAREFYTTKEIPAAPSEEFFFIKCDSRLEKIFTADVLFIEAKGNYISVQTKDKKYITYLTFKGISAQLPAQLFVQVHKSFLVAVQAITSLELASILVGGHELPLSKSYKQEVLDRIEGKIMKR